MPKPEIGDYWGGMAAMLVALPSAIAFGVIIYGPLGPSHLAQGALAGILGTVAIGLITPALGGTNRLISAPCAPAAAVLAAFTLELMKQGSDFATATLLLSLLGLAAGVLQVLFGTVRLGQLIEYMPYPVVSGYLSGVGLYILSGQTPKFLGVPKGMHFWESLGSPAAWQWQGMVVGAVTMLVMIGAPRLTKKIPAAILGLLAGVGTYFALGLAGHALLTLEGNRLVIGSLGDGGGSFSEAMAGRWKAIAGIDLALLKEVAFPALTLAVLLSIDTLKTCVVLDALTHSRHRSNRELIGQGLGNIASAIIGGMPGAGTTGATLVNVSSGGATRFSGVFEGMMALVAFLLLGPLIAWVPVASLAAILIVIGVRMIDRHSFAFLRQRSTILDFAVIAAVVITALTVSLIAASGVGIALAVVLFIREQIGATVVRHKVAGNQTFSKRVRTSAEMEVLSEKGRRTVVVELQGSLFFGTASQLYRTLEPEFATRDFVILDLRRVQTVDVTAVHMLDQIKDILAKRGGFLLLSQLPASLPSGRDMKRYFDQVGLARAEKAVRVFPELDDALEWVEDRLIAEAGLSRGEEKPLLLQEIELFRDSSPETIAVLESHMEKRSCKLGEIIFQQGEHATELFIIRTGLVRVMLPISESLSHHLGTFGRGAFFGEMGFLDGGVRSANAVAYTDAELLILPRPAFDQMAERHQEMALNLMEGIASTIAQRMRYTNAELRALES